MHLLQDGSKKDFVLQCCSFMISAGLKSSLCSIPFWSLFHSAKNQSFESTYNVQEATSKVFFARIITESFPFPRSVSYVHIPSAELLKYRKCDTKGKKTNLNGIQPSPAGKLRCTNFRHEVSERLYGLERLFLLFVKNHCPWVQRIVSWSIARRVPRSELWIPGRFSVWKNF